MFSRIKEKYENVKAWGSANPFKAGVALGGGVGLLIIIFIV